MRVTGKRDAKSLRADAGDGYTGCERLKKQMRVTGKRDAKGLRADVGYE